MTSPAQGHNSGIQGERLRAFIERIESLEAEKSALQSDISEIYNEAKSAGYDPKIMRAVVRLRAMDQVERQERQALLETYMAALGMLADTPLGEAAVARLGATPEIKKMRESIASGEVSIEMDGKRIEADGKGGVQTVEVNPEREVVASAKFKEPHPLDIPPALDRRLVRGS